jgi:hypothetical protein
LCRDYSFAAEEGQIFVKPYSASFAAVPHVVRALSNAPTKADSSFFNFPAWVEICRQKTTTPIPEDLRQAYSANPRGVTCCASWSHLGKQLMSVGMMSSSLFSPGNGPECQNEVADDVSA